MDSFVARQPIFDTEQNVYAYELLFRTSLENRFPDFDPDAASCNVMMDNFILNSVETITEGKKAFINFSEKLLLEGFAHYLPKEHVVIEILETIPANDATVSACKELREKGYIVALDDFVLAPNNAALVPWSNIIKVDFMNSTVQERLDIIRQVDGKNIELLAEKIETAEEYQIAIQEGFKYFQGYFFAKPEIIQGKRMPESKLSKLQLLKEINVPEPDFNDISNVIKNDMSLTYKLLRCINSAANGLPVQVESVHQAVVYLGLAPLRKWVTLVVMAELGSEKTTELLRSSLVRASFCEQLAGMTGFKAKSDDFFLLGLFSLADAIMDRPMTEILDEVPLAPDIKKTLLGEVNDYGYIFEMMTAYDAADWNTVQEICDELNLDGETAVPNVYAEAISWANGVLAMTGERGASSGSSQKSAAA